MLLADLTWPSWPVRNQERRVVARIEASARHADDMLRRGIASALNEMTASLGVRLGGANSDPRPRGHTPNSYHRDH
jgi:hypothetical protein